MKPPKYFYFRVNADKNGITLEDASDVDIVEVVRCRDCIHARHYTNKIKCGYWSEQTASEIVCEDDFCSYGEKRAECTK